ncbi:MAG: large repetitive protein [Solirubrobacteraceae bacterium]|nr:large repetitive protein [Solirubrobacteraceae bacterium]
MRMTRALLLGALAALATTIAVPGVASADPDALAPASTGLTAPTGIARTPDGAVWVADEVRGVCRVAAGALVDSPWCGNAPHQEDEANEPVHAEAFAAAMAPVDAAGAPVAAASASGLSFDPQTDSFYVGDRSASGGGVWRLHYDRANGVIDGATEIAAVADRVEMVVLGPDADGTTARDVFFTTKRAGQIMRIAEPTGGLAQPELVAALGGATDAEEGGIEAMAATDDALYLAGAGLSRLDLSSPNATPQPVAGFEGRAISALAADPARGRLYAGTVAPQLGDVVEVLDVATGEHEPYEQGFATVTTLGVDGDGTVLVADDPSLASQFTAWHARLWQVPVQPTGRPQAAITSSPPAASPATDASLAYRSRDGASFECRLDDGAFAPCPGSGSGEQTYRDVPEGDHRVSIRAKDGLTGLYASVRFTLDRTAPKVTATQPANEYLEGLSAPRVRFSASESGIAYTCSLDGSAFKRCFSGNPVENLTPGVHVLRVVATDAAGNASDPGDPGAAVRIAVLARFSPDVATGDGMAPAPAPAAAVAGTTAASAHKPLLLPFTLRFKDAAGTTRLLRFGLDAPHGSAQLRVTVRDWRGRTVLTRAVTVRPNARNRLDVTLTRAEQRRLRPGRYLVRAVLRTARGDEGNAQTHWLRIRPAARG